jgi:hypothetical protein
VLHHDDSVRSIGQRRPGHDLHRTGHQSRENFTGAHFTGDEQLSRQIGSAHGEPVAGRSVEWRIVAIGENMFGQDSAGSTQDWDKLALARSGLYFSQDALASFIEGHKA